MKYTSPTRKPIRQRPYKLGAKQKEVLENVVSDMLKDGIIEPSTSPWAAPCLLVAKKSNNTTNTDYRFVVDYRRVNECIELNAHPLLTTEDALESVGAKQPTYFSALDLKSGRSLSKQEQQYGITEKECLALVYAVKKFDCYLRFTKFTAYVDHSALKWLLTLKEPTGKFARWIALLQSYSMEILYRPGTTHGNADGVSRREYENVTDQDMEALIDILPSFRINRTIQRTQRSFFWPSIGSDVAEWVKSCELCSQRKRPQKPTKSPISSMPIASQPFERVSTDILGPVSNSGKSKNQYVLVFICYLTKYVELIPLSDIKAATIATAFLHNVVCRHGTPLFLHSDRGVNYLSNIVKETCKLLDIKKTQTTSYRPQCNGQSERMMSTIKDMLSKYIEDNSDWDRYIPFIQFAYNTSPSIDSTDYSPFFLVNGRHPKSFLDTHLPNMEVNVTAREYIVQTLENIEKARAVARENLQEHKTEMLNKANRNRENSTLVSVTLFICIRQPQHQI
ncbi:unnamed protein product [Mytilus edulis]|uniref:Integrase catalytic domain-containing protein n=1 Tax=Mytilus edulis TaxID=6550 RepID=A0A8S3TZD5_MYTED|nr:unnamed protein product [Mytilus edulis]